ncbi:TMEM243 family protein [bacterium]|nr:TMEM243 family protein [bacterium]
MPLTTADTANNILNRVAAEVGLDPVADPWADTAQHFLQMRYLLQTAGEELSMAHVWEWQTKSHSIVTGALDTGKYPLPDDYLQMIDQTGWERSENVPLFGPLSAQDWTYLLGRDLVSYTIYASFRIHDGQFQIFPQPPPEGLNISFEYQSKDWIVGGGTDLDAGTDTPMFDRTLISRYLKVKWLESKGFDTSKAQDDFNAVFGSITSKDKGNEIISSGRNARAFPYLDSRYNTKDSGYGHS